MWRRVLLTCALAFCGTLAGGVRVSALDVPAAPPLNRPVIDQTGTLSSSSIDTISATINQSRTQKDYQMGVLLIPTLGADEYLEGYSLKVARQWGIGTATKDNGVLLLIVMDERKVRIEVGRGLEGDLTDAESSRIIRNVLAAQFRNGAYEKGVEQTVQSIAHQVEGKADPASETSQSSKSLDWTWIFFFGFWILPWLGSVLARSRSWWAGGVIGAGLGVGFAGLVGWVLWALIGAGVLTTVGLLFDFLVSKNYRQRISDGDAPAWWAGGTYWGSGDSGGGFGGGGDFGGGGFGGGGSSGDW